MGLHFRSLFKAAVTEIRDLLARSVEVYLWTLTSSVGKFIKRCARVMYYVSE